MTLEREVLTQDETIASLGNYGYGWSDSDVAGPALSAGFPRPWSAISRERRTNPSGCWTSG